MSSAITDSCPALVFGGVDGGGAHLPRQWPEEQPLAPQRGLGAAAQWGFAEPGRLSQGNRALLFCRVAGLRLVMVFTGFLG